LPPVSDSVAGVRTPAGIAPFELALALDLLLLLLEPHAASANISATAAAAATVVLSDRIGTPPLVVIGGHRPITGPFVD
jgi:hypothetical protein